MPLAVAQVPARRPRVLVVEDQPLVVAGLRGVLESRYDVVGVVRNGLELVRLGPTSRPDVVVFDLGLPAERGLKAIRQCAEQLPACPIIVISAVELRAIADEAFRQGARGFIRKTAPLKEVGRAVDCVLAGQVYRSATGTDQDAAPGGPMAALSPTQGAVVCLIGRGLTTRELAAELGISERTIRGHRSSIRRRLGLRTDFELIRFAILVTSSSGGLGLLEPGAQGRERRSSVRLSRPTHASSRGLSSRVDVPQ